MGKGVGGVCVEHKKIGVILTLLPQTPPPLFDIGHPPLMVLSMFQKKMGIKNFWTSKIFQHFFFYVGFGVEPNLTLTSRP